MGDESRINDAELSQTLCTAVQIAIVNLLSSWGVQANSVIGHSSGEIGEWSFSVIEWYMQGLTKASCRIYCRWLDTRVSYCYGLLSRTGCQKLSDRIHGSCWYESR